MTEETDDLVEDKTAEKITKPNSKTTHKDPKQLPAHRDVYIWYISRRVKPAELLVNRLWFSGPEFLTLYKDSWPSLKVCNKFILFPEIEVRSNDVCM